MPLKIVVKSTTSSKTVQISDTAAKKSPPHDYIKRILMKTSSSKLCVAYLFSNISNKLM